MERQPRKTPPNPPKVDGSTEAQIIALCCSDPPEGRAEWTIRLLTSELKKRQIITEISCYTVWRTLKKLNQELEAWQKERNKQASKVIWRFSTEDARVKLKHLYPVFEDEELAESNASN